MKCLIIAAGQGTRLRSVAPSKPLALVRGVPIIEHIVRMARAGGADEFIVATGYAAGPLEAFLEELAGRVGCPIEAVRNPNWERPNGFSVTAAAERLKGAFILLMSDHLFDPAILAALIRERPKAAALTLAVDRDIANPDIDLDDATKVVSDAAGRIIRIGKTLADYDAIDTGLFIATPALPAAIEESLASGGAGSLSEGVQRLADQGLAFTADITGRWWLDVDDAAAHARAEATLPDFMGA
jgi:choline kinase